MAENENNNDNGIGLSELGAGVVAGGVAGVATPAVIGATMLKDFDHAANTTKIATKTTEIGTKTTAALPAYLTAKAGKDAATTATEVFNTTRASLVTAATTAAGGTAPTGDALAAIEKQAKEAGLAAGKLWNEGLAEAAGTKGLESEVLGLKNLAKNAEAYKNATGMGERFAIALRGGKAQIALGGIVLASALAAATIANKFKGGGHADQITAERNMPTAGAGVGV